MRWTLCQKRIQESVMVMRHLLLLLTPLLNGCTDANGSTEAGKSGGAPVPFSPLSIPPGPPVSGGGKRVGQSHNGPLRSGSVPHCQSHQQKVCQRKDREGRHAWRTLPCSAERTG